MCKFFGCDYWFTHVLETCRDMKYTYSKKKFCVSSWLNTEINDTEKHGQQNVKKIIGSVTERIGLSTMK